MQFGPFEPNVNKKLKNKKGYCWPKCTVYVTCNAGDMALLYYYLLMYYFFPWKVISMSKHDEDFPVLKLGLY